MNKPESTETVQGRLQHWPDEKNVVMVYNTSGAVNGHFCDLIVRVRDVIDIGKT